MNFEGFDYDVFSNSVEEAFKEPAAKLISSKETMLVAGNLLKIKSRINKVAFYLNELIKKVDDLTPEQMDKMNPDQLNTLLEMIFKTTNVPSGVFED